jgi:hypothetical protein
MSDVSIPSLPVIAPVTGDSIPLERAATNLVDRRVTVDALATFAKAGLSAVATSGTYSDLSAKPTLAPVATSGLYTDLTSRPTLGTLSALSGPGGTTTFLRADNTYAAPPGGSGIASYTWASKPVSPSTGTQVLITDVGGPVGSVWTWDGSNWYPINGRVALFRKSGTNAAPIASLGPSVANNSLFSIPGGPIVIPAGVLYPGAILRVNGILFRTSGNGVAPITLWLGTSGTVSDSQVGSDYFSGNALDTQALDFRGVFSSSTSLTTNGRVATWAIYGYAADSSTNVNTAAAMTLSLGFTSAPAADSFKLVNIEVWIM